MSNVGAYWLRRQPGSEAFRRAWEAALDFGVQRLKDIAFERAIEGQLVPVFVAGKLMGFRRKKNDRLLMFCLRMNARAEDGRRLSASYFDPAADRLSGTSSPSPLAGEGDSAKLSGVRGLGTTLTVPGLTRAEKDDTNAAIIQHFDPVDMSLAEIEAMQKMLTEAATRARETEAKDDLGPAFLKLGPKSDPFVGELEDPIGVEEEDFVPFREGEPDWEAIGGPGLDEVECGA